MSIVQKWIEIKRKEVFRKYNRGVDEVQYELPDGTTQTYYLKNESNAVGILAITTSNDVIMIRQYRPGPDRVLLEMPGGYVDNAECSDTAVARELLEETGYEGDIEFVTTCYDDAYSNLVRYCYIARNCHKDQTHKEEANTHVELISIAEFKALLKSGQMTDVEVGYLTLDYINLI